MATNALRSLWAEPRPANPPDRGPRDWALVAVLIGWSVVEVVLRQDLAPRPLLLLAVLAVLGPLLWRRTHPLVAVAVSFGTLTIVDIVRILTGSQGVLLNSISAALILAYALFRWGSGREAASGLGVILLWLAITYVADPMSLWETVAGYAFFLFAAALGAAIRYRAKIRIRDIDQARPANANSWLVNSTTPSPTTSRASPSRPKQDVPSRPPTPSVPSRPSPSSRTQRPAPSPSCAPSSACSAPRRTPSSRRSPAWPRSSSSPPMDRRVPASRWRSWASSTTSAPRSGRRSTG